MMEDEAIRVTLIELIDGSSPMDVLLALADVLRDPSVLSCPAARSGDFAAEADLVERAANLGR